jgi:hypothetical protein
MVLFLAPIAAVGYSLYQKKKKEEEEEQQRLAVLMAKDGANSDENTDTDGVSQDESSAQHCDQETQVFAPILHKVSSMASSDSSRAVVDQETARPSLQKAPQDFPDRILKVTDAWAKKFQAFCDDWEKDIATSRSSHSHPAR